MLESIFDYKVTGLDIGSSAIKIAAISRKDKSYRLNYCDVVYYEKECFNENGEILDFDYLQNVISNLMLKYKYAGKKIAMAIPNRFVAKDNISIPSNLSAQEKEYQIESEANRMLAIGTRASYDYFLNSKSNNSNSSSPSISNSTNSFFSVFAAPRNLIDDRLDLIGFSKKFKPVLIDNDAYAMARNAYQVWVSDSPDKVRFLLCMGHSSSYVLVFHNQEVIYEQNLSTNGWQLTQTIMRYYDLSYAEAESKKISNTLPSGYYDDVLTPYIENSVIDIIQSIQNFFSTSSVTRIDTLYICGGHSLIDGLATKIAKKTHITTQLFNPFLGLLRNPNLDESALRKNMTVYSTAIGLALQGLDK